MMDARAPESWLMRLWWIVVPPFTVVVAVLVFERGCAAPYELLPDVTSRPLLALLVALLYLSAHAWALAAYLITVERSNTLLPSLRTVRALWGRSSAKLVMTAAIFAVEYSSVRLWRLIGSSLFNCGM